MNVKKSLCKSASTWNTYIKFCATKMFPKKHCQKFTIFAVFFLCIMQVKLMLDLDHTYKNSETLLLCLGTDFAQHLP